MVSQAPCYTASEARRYNRPYPPYLGYHERRFHSSSYDGRPLPMADQQIDIESPQQRRRIAVACGRCRKRKIRCSGDAGGGQPCQNCKNAGAEDCLFLRVHSREAFVSETDEFAYSVGDARQLASRAPVVPGMSYSQDLPTTTTYHPYMAASSKPYYAGFGNQYNDEFEYGIGVPPQPVLNNDGTGVAMISGQWPSRPASSKPYQPAPSSSNTYNMESTYYGGPTNMVHRPTPLVTSEPSTLSLNGFGAEIPPAPSSARLLPDPAVRQGSSSLPYPAAKTPIASGATLAHVAAAATYVSSFDASGLNYSSPPQHVPPSSRSDEDIFGEQERSLQSQGASYDMTTYTSEPRRDSMATSTNGGTGGTGGGGGGTLSNGHTYVPSESMHTTPHILPGYLGGGGEVTTPAPTATPSTPSQSQSSHHDRFTLQHHHHHSHMHPHSHAHPHPHPHHASSHTHSHAAHNSHSHGHGHNGNVHDHTHAHGLPPPTSAPSPHQSGSTNGNTSHADAHRVAAATRR